eukprot:2491630-Prymnesium_polylepis.2
MGAVSPRGAGGSHGSRIVRGLCPDLRPPDPVLDAQGSCFNVGTLPLLIKPYRYVQTRPDCPDIQTYPNISGRGPRRGSGWGSSPRT